ncbi:TIGR03016 family PEP-CTERM system-associated outer membrane protein [Roseateles sp. NT4]|uniref:TIGR03016 family PEP-CTERM system-associated outer membrane protein n=1 Tax=Roseateles sp. NT4 TaxID=3453715 RepID=UPI003EEC4EBF
MAAMTRRKAEPRHLPLALAFLALVAQAQEGGGSGGAIQPRIGVSLSATDNLRLNDKEKDAALIATVSPGISVVRNTGTLRGSVDYSLSGITYLKTSYGSRVQNALTANGQAELIPRTLSVDVHANIGQQNASAFGLQSTPTQDSSLANSNQHETGTLAVSPLLHGQFGGLASFDLRGDFAMTQVRDSAVGDSHSAGGSLHVAQLNAGVLGWYLQLGTQQYRPKTGVSNRNSTATAGLNYRPNPDWVASVNAGKERNDYEGGSSHDGFTGGVTAEWTPTPRTRISGNWQSHSYGNSHGLNFEHRMRNSVWRFSDNRNVTLGNTGSIGGVRTNYDLFFLLFASTEPDPVKRDALVRAALASIGLSPDAPANLGFLSTGPSRLRSQMLSFMVEGVRSNVTASISRFVTTRLGSNLNQGDLANSALIEQRSYSLSGSYQLTPVSGLSLTALRQETSGDSSSQRTKLTSFLANWNNRLGSRISMQLGARHSRFEGVTPYTENSVYANLTQQF